MPERLNDIKYFVFLQQVLPDLPQGIPVTVCQNMIDNAAAHFSIAVHNHLDDIFSGSGLNA